MLNMSETLKFNTPIIDAEGNVKNLADFAGSSAPELLWENPDTTVNFTYQTLTDIDLKNYTHILILAKNTSYTEDFQFAIVTVKETSDDFTNARDYTAYIKGNTSAPSASNAGNKNGYIRQVKACRTDKTIYIGSGYTNTATNTTDSALIPAKIYGIDLSSILA